MTRWIVPDEVADRLKPGMTVFVAGASSEPREILDALARHGDKCAGVRFVSISVPGMNGVDFCALHEQAMSTVFLATRENRASIASGRADFIPLQYRAIFAYLEHELEVNVVITQLAPGRTHGTLSLGLGCDFVPAVLDKAELIIGEVNSRQPVPADAPTLALARLGLGVACERAVPSFPVAEVDDAARSIGRYVGELIRDGDCLQMGIGAIPDASLRALTDKNDLGFHSGMITDGVMALAQAGNLTGRSKTLDRGKIVTGVTLGSPALIEWAGNAPELALRPVSYTHDTGVVQRIDHFVSINSALQVDLFGQVNADMLEGRQLSGTGGSVDMMRGAALSRGGRAIIALNATAAAGKVSRIIAALAPNTAASALRTDVDYVVTEYGARRIRHLPVAARAEALIEVAAPQFRDGLRDEWRELSRI